ncbi:acyltransferase family protein [Butyrivibrio sp. AE3004]|uniref:acyltransferase family protein n=1 Tax=Butyrivibrio sp. AE3004 TaxID=1506994 RepID=UPI000493FE0B|nr:acyltransferase [Butyrivibrio sp. AE3004]
MNSRTKIESLQGLRAIAFICIFLSHCNIAVLERLGNFGVSLFFVLSGFLMVYSYYKSDGKNDSSIIDRLMFSWNKIRKLYPLHIVAMIIAVPIRYYESILYSETFFFPMTLVNLVLNSFLLQSWIPNMDIVYSLNGVVWYLSTCAFHYFMFPWLIKSIRKYKGVKEPITISVILFAVQAMLSALTPYLPFYQSTGGWKFSVWFSYIFPISRLVDFIIGCNLGYIFISKKHSDGKRLSFYIGMEFLSVFLFLCSSAIYNTSIINKLQFGKTTIWTIPTCMIIYIFALNKGVLSKILTHKFLVFLGDLSSYTFIVHQLVIKICMFTATMFVGEAFKKNPIVLFSAFCISIAIAVLWRKYFVIRKCN